MSDIDVRVIAYTFDIGRDPIAIEVETRVSESYNGTWDSLFAVCPIVNSLCGCFYFDKQWPGWV